MKYILSLFISLILLEVSAQEKTPVKSIDLIYKGYEHYQEQEYEKALDLFGQVSINDTNYLLALSEKALMFSRLERYEEMLEACNEGIRLKKEYLSDFYLKKGACLIKMDQHEKAILLYKEALKIFPKNHVFYYNMAIAFRQLEQYEPYMEHLKKTLEIYPYYADAHLELGSLALHEGKISQALMAYFWMLLIEPASSRAQSILVLLDEAVSSKIDFESKNIDLSARGDDFSETDLIIKNYAALNKSYKVKSKLDLPLIRQAQVLFERLEYDPDDPGYWMQTYVRLFKDIYREDWFEPFSYYLIKSSANAKHQKLVKKNQGDIDKFILWANERTKKYIQQQPFELDGQKQILQRWYYSGNNKGLMAVGNKKDGVFSGCWEIYYESGAINAKGCYNDNGERTGAWNWYYEDGSLKETGTFEKGKLQGLFIRYYENGNKAQEGSFDKGMREGEYLVYHQTGGISERLSYTAGSEEGSCTLYHEIGTVKFSYTAKDNNIHGVLKQYYSNGELNYEMNYKEGKRVGITKEYYNSGELASVYPYKDGIVDGEWLQYYRNGNVKKQGKSKEGINIGEEKMFYKDGTLSGLTYYDENGKQNGIYKDYDRDGKLLYELDYKKGDVVAYRFFNKKGEVVSEDKKKKGNFEYRSVYPDGTLKMEGIYSYGGGKTGHWKYYNHNGILDWEETFENGKNIDKVKTYHPDGNLKLTKSYENGSANGYFARYYRHEKLEREGFMVDGETHGDWYDYNINGTLVDHNYYLEGALNGYQLYYAENGKLDRKEYYENGKRVKAIHYDSLGTSQTIELPNGTGEYHRKFSDGKPAFIGNYVAGLAHGEFTWYYPNGKIRIKGQYHDHSKNGKWLWYYPDGSLSRERQYHHGDAHGKWVSYHENGKIKAEETYDYGLQTGEEKNFYEDGKLFTLWPYHENMRHGGVKFYNPTGELEHIRYYHYGKMIGYSHLDEDKKEVEMIPFEKETGEVVSYYPGGNISRKYKVDKGDFIGDYLKYYPNGQLYQKDIYWKDQRHGVKEGYYPDGQLKLRWPYQYDLRHGKSQSFYPNGNLKEEEVYLCGSLHGKSRYYNREGKLVQVRHYYDDELISIEDIH